MAGCPRCSSPEYRLQEFGAITNSYLCSRCLKVFDRPTPAARIALLSVLMGVGGEIIGTVGDIVKELFDDSGGGI
jgi:hypothetical protein